MKKVLAFFMALVAGFSGSAVAVVGSTNAKPIQATQREYRYDQDKLQFGVYCFPKHDNYTTLRKWFKEAGLNFAVCCWGQQYTEEDFDWMQENGIGMFVPNTDYYKSLTHDAVWGVDYRDEPGSDAFAALGQGVKELYAQDAHRFPLINLFPMYASDEQLGEYPDLPGSFNGHLMDAFNYDSLKYRMHVNDYLAAVDSDIISVDIYPLDINEETGKLETYCYWLRNLDILADACRATGRDLWVITQAAGNCKDEGGGKRWCDTAEDQRWQNYVSLAFGAKAIVYGCYYTGWWDQGSHMINDAGNRTETYYAVKKVNEEISVFADVYGRYVNHGAVLYNRANPNCAGAKLGLVKVEEKYKPVVTTAAPVLCGCFTEKEGDGRAYVFANMYEPETGKEARFTATFPGAQSLTVYRKGEIETIKGSTLTLKLENREGVFVTVNGENPLDKIC
ncbi:MAG: hypothetical protein IJK89_06930 [Clostridia bacterium]|nr:hypothetical protein [Clostridia bacterium]